MIEAFSIPVLLKALDFLFEEVPKILQERREMRKSQDQPASQQFQQSNEMDVVLSKEVALQQKIKADTWKKSEGDVHELLDLLEIYKTNYYQAKRQQAMYGIDAPPIVLHRLTDAEDGIAEITKKLQVLLSLVYGKQVTVPEIDRG
jgi:hypothetical protein